ncbi:MAG: RsmD family RNA methyltransferase [Bacteroidota bacterium]
MRIIGGTHRSRRIDAPRNLPLRPTTDFAKESLFNILENRADLSTLTVLDLFSGTGAISYEFASRGASRIIAVEKNTDAFRFIRRRSAEFGFHTITAIRADVFRFLESCKDQFDIIFADPPYELEQMQRLPELVFGKGILKAGGLLIIEHGSKINFSKAEQFLEKRVYGEVNFSIFSLKTSDL